MNEIKKIHLGRQPFTISIEAHRLLRAYLDAIEHQVGKKGEDVLKEIELRMAELLTERGISADKVVLEEDVEFLKEQLGKPGDFKDEAAGEGSEGEHASAHTEDDDQPKRLYRDTENAMVAGVAAGLAAYFHIDPLIVRLLFVVLTFGGGAGILTYILLWVLVPEAKSPSERLQMRGKAVTVDNIKTLIDRADVPAAANRAGTAVGRVLTGIARVFLAFIGIICAIAGSAALLWAMATGTYLLVHGGKIGADIVFPVSTQEGILLGMAMVTAIMIGFLVLFMGLAMVKRKWLLPSWLTATIFGLFFISSSVGTALAFDAFPAIRERYRDAHKTQTRVLPEFKNVNLAGNDIHYTFKQSSTYSVAISAIGKVDEQNVTTKVEGDTLKIDGDKLVNDQFCFNFCFYSNRDLDVTIYAPSIGQVVLRGDSSSFAAYDTFQQKELTVDARIGTHVDLAYVETLKLLTNGTCEESDPIAHLRAAPKELFVNGTEAIKSTDQLNGLRTSELSNDYNCVVIRQ